MLAGNTLCRVHAACLAVKQYPLILISPPFFQLPPACDSYELPYFDYVNPDPSFEEMHAVVCAKVSDSFR